MNYSNSPAYLLSIVSAVWFTLMAFRFRKSLVLWCIGGAVLGLCVSSICLGLAHAVTLPYTNSEIRRMQWVGVTWTIVIIGITSAIIAAANRNRISSGQKIVSARTSESSKMLDSKLFCDPIEFLQPQRGSFVQGLAHAFKCGMGGAACGNVLLILIEGLLEDIQPGI